MSVIGYKYTYLGGEGVMLQTGGYGMCMKGLNTCNYDLNYTQYILKLLHRQVMSILFKVI